MDEVLQSSGSLPPFLLKTYEMVEDSSCDSIVSWSSSNESFIVLNLPELERVLLPRFFKHSNFSSFNRQLNTYGFRKIDPERWEFAHENFIKGQPHLLKNIHRRKPVHSHSLQSLSAQGASPMAESERRRCEKTIQGLKQNKEQLLLEIQKHEKDREIFELEIQMLNKKFKQLLEHRNKLVSFLARVLKIPSLDLNLVPQFEFHDRKRRIPRADFCQHDEFSDEDDDQLGTSQSGLINFDRFEILETFLAFLENFVLDIRQTSNIELDESTTFSESQSMSEIPLKSPGIDMNSEPVPVKSSGVNDMFWEQFLTENPGSSDSQEAQSEIKDSYLKMGETKVTDHGKFWWNMKIVNNLTKRIDHHLTPVEKSQV